MNFANDFKFYKYDKLPSLDKKVECGPTSEK